MGTTWSDRFRTLPSVNSRSLAVDASLSGDLDIGGANHTSVLAAEWWTNATKEGRQVAMNNRSCFFFLSSLLLRSAEPSFAFFPQAVELLPTSLLRSTLSSRRSSRTSGRAAKVRASASSARPDHARTHTLRLSLGLDPWSFGYNKKTPDDQYR